MMASPACTKDTSRKQYHDKLLDIFNRNVCKPIDIQFVRNELFKTKIKTW